MKKYSEEVELCMRNYFSQLSEPLRRQYAYLEAQKLGFGGKRYIGSLLVISQKAIRRGEAEVKKPELLEQIPAGGQRRPGGGRKKFCPTP